MAFLNPREELVNIILTQHGRENLATKGTLGVKYYAFADDEVDYQLLSGTLLSTDTIAAVDNFYFSIGQNPPDNKISGSP